MGVTDPVFYGDRFYEIFLNAYKKNNAVQREVPNHQQPKNPEKKKAVAEKGASDEDLKCSSIELEANSSKFGVFAAIRGAVLEAETKQSLVPAVGNKTILPIWYGCCMLCVACCKLGDSINCRCHSQRLQSGTFFVDNDSDDSDKTVDITQREMVQRVPQIVGAGLKSLFELISEAKQLHPNLCTKALKALLDVIQGQYPESFKSEPPELIDQLYDLLLDISTFNGHMGMDPDSKNWSAIACSALLGLCVARGDTGKMLKAIAAILMSPKQVIQLPVVLNILQRSVIAVALNRPTKPDIIKNGIPMNCLICSFSIEHQLPGGTEMPLNLQPSMASDGRYLYILVGKTLLKIGSGFNGTLKGDVYAVNNEFSKEVNGWLGYANNTLFYRKTSKKDFDNILVVNTETLKICGTLNTNRASSGDVCNLVFADGESLNAIYTTKDESLVVKQIDTSGASNFDLPLKLARKTFRTYGYAQFEAEVLNQSQIQKIASTFNAFEPKLSGGLELSSIACGKDFGLVRTTNGKVYYYGKASALGLKSVGKSPTLKLTELIISKVANIVHVSIGHDGIHALLVGDDGSVFFTGTARRNEDGDLSKTRRQPKATKPKKITRMDDQDGIVYCSSNNGTSAFVTKSGKLIMFGKDTSNCDSTGVVTDLADQHITKVALGKAHCVALNSRGQLFTFGFNNKGQCGRPFTREKDSHLPLSMETSESKSLDGKNKTNGICDPDDHFIVVGICRICTVCKECTGFNIACVSTLNIPIDERIPGAKCACGPGCSGCSKCGACATCINYQDNDNLVDANNREESHFLDVLTRPKSNKSSSKKRDRKGAEETGNQSDIERDQPKFAPLSPQKLNLPTQSPVIQIACGLHHTVVLTQLREVFTFGSNQYGQLGTGDLQPVSGVVQVKIHGIPTQVAAGANHTILLNQKGVVYTFGSYLKGQLGRLPPDGQLGEDIFSSGSSNRNDKTYSANDILAHRQKYLWNCSPAAVQGIGSNSGKRATWVGGSGDQTFIRIDESLVSISMLSKVNVVADRNAIVLIPNTPLTFDCLAINRRDGSCNVHNINQTNFMKLIKANQENCSRIESDKINKNVQPEQQAQGSYSYKKKKNNPEINSQLAFALESTYGNLWVFDGFSKNIYCYNVIASEMIDHFNNVTDMKAILTPELALPSSKTDSQVTRYQASMNLLACLDILTSASDAIPHCFEMASPVPFTLSKENQASDYQSVCRFENLGGGWGYTGHSVEAIRFMADTNIIIGGFGMYGGRGDYTCKLKLYDLGMDGGGYEKDGLLVAETEDIPFECPSRSKFSIMLPKPITASSGRWFLVWAKISGPSSDCGAAGQAVVTTDDQVVFTFKSSKKSNNSTGVNSGQIPSILYKVVNVNKPLTGSDIEAVHKISKLFANSVSKECFDSLIALCKWSWNTFMGEKMNYSQSKSNLDRLLYISKACLRLLRKYTNEIYPLTPKRKTTERNPPVVHDFSEKRKTYNGSGASSSKSPSHSHVGLNMDLNTPTNKRVNSENILLAECVGSVRALLKDILCDEVGCESDLDYGAYGMYLDILEECHTTFVSCFNAFFPTSTLKWNILCELLSEADSGVLHGRYLSAVIAGLSSPNINLRKTFSLLTPQRDTKSIVSPSDNLGLPMLSSIENHIYPVLVEQMIYRTQQEKTEFQTNLWTFKDVLVKLLNLIAKPIELKVGNIRNQSAKYTQMEFETKIHQGLIDNCCLLLKRVLAEIVYQSCITEIDQNTPLVRSIQSTGSRYARVDTTRTWNTGNFGPDAIAFSVDKSGIAIAGAMIYSGSGTYDYQLELLQDTMDSKLTSQNRWDTLESTSGTYDQDAVQNDMVEIRFSHPIRVREHCRYAIRLCSQGAKTCFGDSGVSSLSGPCGVTFSFFPCDLSFNGTTPNRGQIPCLLYYSSPNKFPNQSGKMIGEIHARDIALNIASDIVKKCMELLVYVREILETGTETDKSGNSSNRHLIDSEHNITPIEEHLDVSWMTNANHESPLFKARDITKKLESFTKGIVETLKLDKSKTNPFECEIEIGATEISTNDLVNESDSGNGRRFRMSGVSEDGDDMRRYLNRGSQNDSDDDDDSDSPFNIGQIVDIFGYKEATMFHTLLPVVLALVGPLVNSDPKSSVHVLGLIRQFLPHVTALNRQFITKDISSMQILMKSVHEEQICNDFINENHGEAPSKVNYKAEDKSMKMYELMNSGVMSTTSRHCCTVESDHPYKSASITTYRVVFPPCVQWFSIEFDPQCGTAQPEDYLTLSIPVHFSDQTGYLKTAEGKSPVNMRNIEASVCSLDDDNASTVVQQKLDSDDWIMIKKYNKSSNWDDKCIILPGNRLELSFETASNYLNDRQCNRFGFKCLVIGYDNPSVGQFTNSCLIRLEHELSYLAGSCCANLLKNKLVLPDDAADEIVTEDHEIDNHFNLLTKGLTLPETMLTINQALDSHLPIGNHSNERQFLKDFVTGAPGSAGARLAAWLQPESRLDPNKCELKISDESIYCGWPTELVVVIRDQYDDVVVVPDIKVEINVTPAETTVNGNRKSKRVSFLMADQGILPKVPYESTVKEKMNYNAITFMKAYDNFSFEELRYFEPNQSRVSESLLASDKKNGQFGCSWTPTATGGFCLTVVIDGLPLEEVHRVDVKETGVPPPPPKFAEKRIQPQATKLRKFIAKYSAGLRIRSHPTLQSAQVGVLSMNGIISFIDEIQNDDGIWVRLSTESIRQHCVATWFPTEAWCLQYNQHLNKKLLFPVIDGQLEESANDDDQDQSLPGSQSNEEASPDAQDLVQPQIDRQAKDKDVINNRNPFHEADSFESTEMTDLRKQSQSPNQSNLGSTIAVVVGEGANKLQQLHKWFKGDSVDLKTGIKKRGDELIGNRPELDGSPQSESCPSSPKLMANRRDPDSTSWTNGQELKRHTFVVATPTTPEISKCSRKFKTKRALGADSLSKTSSSKNSRNNSTEDYTALKRALPPALAESLRAVFAAFLWHEGIVHDAMACSSYLKFHPMIPKYGEASSEGTDDSSYVPMTKEEKAQQRHSVEVVNSDNYNVTTPYKSTLDTLAKSGYSSINNRRRTMQQEKTKLHSLPETTVLPPALKCLVFLWEQLSSKCVDLVQSKSFGADVQRDLFPIRPPRNKNEHIFDGIGKGTVFLEKEHRKTQSSKEDGSFCELCETYLIMPVTFHMRSHHSGCGKSSKGKGYNSVGTYCDGWAGNCGEGGKGATSWYLLCEKCRDNYLARQRKPHETKSRSESVYGLSASTKINTDVYRMIKENALFLLELSNNDNENYLQNQKKSPQSNAREFANPRFSNTSFNYNGNLIPMKQRSRFSGQGLDRKSTLSENIESPELLWPAPDIFSCFELLSSTTIDEPLEFGDQTFGPENFGQRPLSEVSFDYANGAENFAFGSQNTSKFHRSLSMGHGWMNSNSSNNNNNMGKKNFGKNDTALVTDSDKVVFRRKNRAACDDDTGSLLLCHPSNNLLNLVPKDALISSFSSSKDVDNCLNCLTTRPSMSFIFEQHNLDRLRAIMRRSLRVAICRIYSLQAFNWLMRTVTQTICLHDLMWFFVTSLNGPHWTEYDDNGMEREQALDHPVTSTKLSGQVSGVVSQSLHSFLQSVADLTLLLPPGSAVQQMAIQCFGMRFRQSDHQFLHRSHVFGNISKILSRSDEQSEDLKVSGNFPGIVSDTLQDIGCRIVQLIDLQGMFEVSVSSRPAMASALIDNSTETFWESDEEDRNKSKFIEISMLKLNYVCKQISIHIDNSRDIGNKVNSIIFYSGQSLGDMNLVKSIDFDGSTESGCWISAPIKDESATHFRIVLNGQDPTLRVRNIKLLGYSTCQPVKFNIKINNSIHMQQKNCEAATLKVFRLLTGQVFGKLILGQRDSTTPMERMEEAKDNGKGSNENSLLADSLDMREHMVGILFSRSKLSHLQKQVIVHIVHAIRKETQRARNEWEMQTNDGDQKSDSASENSRSTDTYCFEMLSMVLALSGSSVGRSYLSQQYGLLKDLLILLHVGSDRVQRQVTSLLRRILPEINPVNFADLLGVMNMPPSDFGVVQQSAKEFDINEIGVMDIFLAVISKALHLQVKKMRANTGNQNKNIITVRLSQCLEITSDQLDGEAEGQIEEDVDQSSHSNDFELNRRTKDNPESGQRWFLKGRTSIKQAENMILFLRDICQGKLNEVWSQTIKAAIAEVVVNLTRLDGNNRCPESCLNTPTLWLALAGLCVLDKEHVEKLSSSQWSNNESRPLCSNHDDDVTTAVIQCNTCSFLCGDCDRFLHLNRKTRSHIRSVCKEEEEAIRVELHESCGRIKLFWLLALADSKTLNAMVEFRDGKNSIISQPPNFFGRCRFCGVSENSGLLAIGNVCADSQCQEYATFACVKVKLCGHICGGVANEQKCLPCLHQSCHNRENDTADLFREPKLTQDADDMCMICFTEALSAAPSCQLDCGHVFHYHCCKAVLLKRWTGPRISFGFCQCPICKADIQHELLNDILEPIRSLKNDVQRKAKMRLEYEGVLNQPSEMPEMIADAMDRYAYYVCFKCNKAYYGGEVRCDAEMGDKFNPEELVCGACSDVARAQMCPKHGTDFLEYKCRYCCSVAVFFCFGTTHFCDTCHDDFQRLTNIPKNKLPKCPAAPKAKQLYGEECPLHIVHPPTGEEFALGCGICRNAQTF